MKEQGVDRLWLLSSDGAEFGRQREGDQEIRDRQQQGMLLGKPGLGSLLRAGRAVAAATGVVTVAGELTGGASVNVAAKRLGPTRFNRLHRLQLACGQRVATARAIGLSVAAE